MYSTASVIFCAFVRIVVTNGFLPSGVMIIGKVSIYLTCLKQNLCVTRNSVSVASCVSENFIGNNHAAVEHQMNYILPTYFHVLGKLTSANPFHRGFTQGKDGVTEAPETSWLTEIGGLPGVLIEFSGQFGPLPPPPEWQLAQGLTPH